MNLKPIYKIGIDEAEEEIQKRIGSAHLGSISLLNLLRHYDIGTGNLKPPEPDWKRWRDWPDEKPFGCVPIRWRDKHGYEESGVYIRTFTLPFISDTGGMLRDPECWRYLEPPIEWRSVEKDGNPTEEGWYWVLTEIHASNKPGLIEWSEDDGWQELEGTDITHYCPIAPPPPYEAEQ